MKLNVPPQHPRGAFTLIELLTVIAIIAILMGLLFPALSAVKESGRKTQARNDVQQIVAAVKNYHTEYGRYPDLQGNSAPGGADNKDLGVGDKEFAEMKDDNKVLFNPLRAIDDSSTNKDHEKNPRRIVFFEGQNVSNVEQPRGGFVDRGTGEKKGNFYDPWGSQYNIVVDSNYDNKVDMRDWYTDVPEDESPRTGVVAFALGKDQKLGTKGDKNIFKKDVDDIVSWKN